MPDTLIDAIAKRLQRPSRDVERALGALVGALQDQLADQGSAELPGLGRLVKSGDRIAFESDPALADAVNYRFASGDSPRAAPVLEDAAAESVSTGRAASSTSLSRPEWTALEDGPSGDSGALGVLDGTGGDEFALDDLAAEAGGFESSSPVSPPFDPGDDDPEDVLAATQSLVEPPAAESFAPPPAGEVWSTPPPPSAEVYEQSTEDLAASLPTEEARALGPLPPAPARRSRTPRREQRGLPVPLIFGALIVIAALVAALLWLRPDPGATSSVEDPAIASQGGADQDGLATADDSLGASGQVDGAGLPTQNNSSEASQERTETAAAATPAPIRTSGDAFSTSSAGYTLIVGSTVDERGARTAIRRFNPLGLPMAVLAYQTGDETRFRLCVGQYDTAQAADQSRRQFADQLPEGTWVRRIRP